MSGDGTGPLAPYRSDRESRKPTIDNNGRFVLKHLGGEPILRWLAVLRRVALNLAGKNRKVAWDHRHDGRVGARRFSF